MDNLLLYRGRSWGARAYSRRVVYAVVAVADPALARKQRHDRYRLADDRYCKIYWIRQIDAEQAQRPGGCFDLRGPHRLAAIAAGKVQVQSQTAGMMFGHMLTRVTRLMDMMERRRKQRSR